MLEIFTNKIKEECENAIKYGIYGTQEFHIEKIEQIEDKDGAWNFLVTTWNEIDENSRTTKEMSLYEIMDLLGRVIGHRALNADLIRRIATAGSVLQN